MSGMTDIVWPEWGSAPPSATEVLTSHGHQGACIAPVPETSYSVIHCESCILNHVVPLPDAVFLERYYRRQFYRHAHPDYQARYEQDRP